MTLQVPRDSHLWRIPWHHQVSSAAAVTAVITYRRTDEKRLSRRGGRKNEPYLWENSTEAEKHTRQYYYNIVWHKKKKKNVETKNQKKSCPDTEGITILFAFLSNFSDAIDTCAAEPLKNLFL